MTLNRHLFTSAYPTQGVELSADEWQANTQYKNGYAVETDVIVWYWEVVNEFSGEERAKLLRFATARRRLPLGGFANLSPSFSIVRATRENADDDQAKPTAHTCFNQLVLPAYSTKELLREQLVSVLEIDAFGFL